MIIKVRSALTIIDDIAPRNEHERLMIVFSDNKKLYFKAGTLPYERKALVLDIEQTSLALVDEILLPPNHIMDRKGDEDLFSIITIEQYRQLCVAYLRFNESNVPYGKKGMYIWKMSKLNRNSSSRYIVREDHKIKRVEPVTLDS